MALSTSLIQEGQWHSNGFPRDSPPTIYSVNQLERSHSTRHVQTTLRTRGEKMERFLLLGFLLCGFARARDVSTTSGLLKGDEFVTESGSVFKYFGVPYARPPTGDLRFRPPVILTSMTDNIIDATRHRLPCPQPPHLYEVISPLLSRRNNSNWSEDCLYLNLYVPKSTEKLPVMVWLAGEGFNYADPDQYDGTHLALLGKVIVVTVSYRVSVFGFLSSLTPDAPGNVGLLDQRMALQWIQDNIGNFGGDSKKVTLFGRFTGAMAITMHLASPLHFKQTLFQRAIVQSGVATGPYIFENKPVEALNELAKMAECSNAVDNIKCLKSIPAHQLLAKALKIAERWRPVIDGDFLAEDPMTAFEHGRQMNADILFGTNKDEGSICLLTLYFMNMPVYQDIQGNSLKEYQLKDLIKDNLIDYYKSKNAILEKVAYDKYRYFEDVGDLRDRYVQFCGDLYIKSSMEKIARLNSLKNQVYIYQFDHRPTFSIQSPFLSASHGDDVLFTFGLAYDYLNATSQEKSVSRKMVSSFANFARNGSPVFDKSTWPSYTYQNRAVFHFNIDMKNNSTSHNRNDKIFSFWDEVVPSLRGCQHRDESESELGSSFETRSLYNIDIRLSTRTIECLIFVLIGMIVFLVIILVLIIRSTTSFKYERYGKV